MPAILVVSGYAHGPSTRPEAEILIALARRPDYRIAVVTHAGSPYAERFRAAGIGVIVGHPTKRRDAAATALIRRELAEGRYDVLMLYNSRGIANGIRAARGLPVRVAVYRGYAGDLRWYDPTNYLKHFHPRVDAILCNNRGVQAHIQANTLGRDKTTVVYKGHDLAWYPTPAPFDFAAELGIPAGVPVVVCVANAAKFKGVPVLLRAMARVQARSDAYLVLCGRRMDTPAHRRLIDACPHPDRIILPGFREDVHAVVAGADLKVLPSVRGESLTKAVLEAMALGTCCLITDIPGNEELVVHGASGWKVPPGDPDALAEGILLLLGDDALRAKLAHGGRERIRTVLSHARTVEGMDEFFRGLAAA